MTSERPHAGYAEAPGLPDSIRLWLASAAGYVHARLELFGLEAKGAAVNYLQIALLLIGTVVCLFFGYVFLVIAAAFLVSLVFHWNWGWITLAFGVGHLLLAVTCVLLAKNRFSHAGFPSTVAEFRKDKEWLSQKKNPTRSATLSAARTN